MTEKDTEQKILDAAQDIFVRKGLDGTRMHEIAEQAGINKALLHYYFRTKEKLFLKVFSLAFPKILPRTMEIFDSDMPFLEKMEHFIDRYISLIGSNQALPLFVISELAKNPDKIVGIMKEAHRNMEFDLIERIKQDVAEEIRQGRIIDIDHRQLFVNVLSLCVFPFIGRPVITYMGFDNDRKEYEKFLKTRKKQVYEFVVRSITP